MESVKKHITATQVTAMVQYMKEHPDVAAGQIIMQPGDEKNDIETQWHTLTEKLNAMGGSVKSIDQWKKTWSYLKYSHKKRGPHKALRRPRPPSDSNGKSLSNKRVRIRRNNDDNAVPTKKECVSFDEELVNIERDKLNLEREYKIQKIEALCRIAAALENLANKS